MRARGSERAAPVGWSFNSSAVWVVPCLSYPSDLGCAAAGGPTMALIRVVSSVWAADLLERTFVPSPDGSIANFAAPIYTSTTASADPATWPQTALAAGLISSGWTASAPGSGEYFVLAMYSDPAISNAYAGYTWSQRWPTVLSEWGCSDDCGRLGFGYPTAIALARDVVVTNAGAIGTGINSLGLATSLLQAMYLSYTRGAPDVRSYFMGLGAGGAAQLALLLVVSVKVHLI